jgi:hypothetical protein
VPHVSQGSIILANVTDTSGQNPKVRPLVVLTANSELASTNAIVAAAVTKGISNPPADDEVPLQWHPEGRCRTKLRMPCGVKCSWLCEVKLADIVEVRGHCPPAQLEHILEAVGKLSL